MKTFKRSFVILTILTVFWLSSVVVFAEHSTQSTQVGDSTTIAVTGNYPQLEWSKISSGQFMAMGNMTGNISIGGTQLGLSNDFHNGIVVQISMYCAPTTDGKPDVDKMDGFINFISNNGVGYCLNVSSSEKNITINGKSVSFKVESGDNCSNGDIHKIDIITDDKFLTRAKLDELGIPYPTYNSNGGTPCNTNTISAKAETEEERAERLLQEYLSSPIVKESIDTVSSINKMPADSKGTMNVDCDYITCLTPGMAKAMAAHPGMSYVITMKYKGVKYRFTIPAGYDVNSLLGKDGYAGVLYLNMVLKGTVVQ